MNKSTQLILVGTLGLFLSGCMGYSTGSTEVGVRTVKWSLLGKKGVEEKIYAPGSTYFFLPFVNDWHTFDTRLRNLEMTGESGRGDRNGRDDLVFKTIDGNDISLDVVISYRIVPEKAPLILQTVATDDETLQECIVRTITRSKPRDIFGELDTEDFYTADKRTEKADLALIELNKILEPYGVIIERVNMRDYRFNPEYQLAIEKKKVADQEAERLKAETNAKKAEFEMQVQKMEADMEKIKVNADGEFERAKIEADAYYEKQLQIAEAVMAEGKAEAEAVSAMNEALSGPGGENMMKLEIANALLNKRIMMLPMGGGGLDVRTTDINQLLQTLGVQKLTEQKPKAASATSAGVTSVLKPLQRPADPPAPAPAQQ